MTRFSYNWLQEYIGKKLPEVKKLADILTLHSFEVESVTKAATDYILEIDVLPNRAHDALGHIGMAREIAALLNAPFLVKSADEAASKIRKSGKGGKFFTVIVQEKNLAPRYMAQLLRGVKVGPSPKWLQERLMLLGMRSINNIVDAANYVMLETGEPLHAFDFDKITGPVRNRTRNTSAVSYGAGKAKTIIVRNAKMGEKFTTLDGEEYKLEPSMLVIADENDILALAGIKGGKKAAITDDTKNIILEAATFDFVSVRGTSQRLNLKTDSSYRFEHGLPITFPPVAMERLMKLIVKIAGGQVGESVDVLSAQPRRTALLLTHANLERVLGVSVPRVTVEKILKSLGFKIVKKSGGVLTHVPSFRLDIEREEDLIEEVARIYGYENITPVIPHGELFMPAGENVLAWDRLLKQTLAGLGVSEVYSLSFLNEHEKEIWSGGETLVEVQNPISAETKYLRGSLLPKLTAASVQNTRNDKDGFLFELGHVFHNGSAGSVVEEERLAIIGSRRAQLGSRESSGNAALFYEAKGIVDELLRGLRVSDIWYDPELKPQEEKESFIFRPGHKAQIKTGDTLLGWIGEMNPKIINGLKGRGSYVGVEFDWHALKDASAKEYAYRSPAKYPAAVRDVALLVPLRTHADSVIGAIYDAGGPLVADVDLFDMYASETFGKDLQNVAFHIIFQAEDRTLTAEEVDKMMRKIARALATKGWEIRE